MTKLSYDLSEIADAIPQLSVGTFPARLVSCTKGKSKNSGNPTLTWDWMLLGGPDKGQRARSWTSLQEQALFNLKQHLIGLGFKKSVEVDTETLIGKKVRLAIQMRDRLVNGKTVSSASVVAVLPLVADTDSDDEDEEEETPKKKKKAVVDEDDEEEEEAPKKKKKPVDEDEEEEEERPRKKKPAADDDEEEETPKKKLKTVAKRKNDDDEEPF